MSMSKAERLADIQKALTLFCDHLGPQWFGQFLIDARRPEYSPIQQTTWLELVNERYINKAHSFPFLFNITAYGWTKEMERRGLRDDSAFKETLGKLCRILKDHVKGRTAIAAVSLANVSRETGIPEGVVASIISANLIEGWLGRHGAKWADNFQGSLIVVPITFGLEKL